MSKEKLGWGIVAVVLALVSVLLGVTYPIPPAPADPVLLPETLAGALVDRYYEALRVGKTLQVDGTTTLTGAATLSGALAAPSVAIGGGYGSTGCSISAAGVLQCDGAATLGSTLSVAGATTLAGLNKVTAGSVVTVSNGTAFTLTATFQPLTAASAVTPTLTIPAAGAQACIYNTSANAIVLQDAGNQVLSADATLGQYDMLCGYSDGTRFVETSRSNN